MSPRPDPVDAHVGRRLKERRTVVGMSQERLGEILGVTYQQVQKYERGANRIGAGRLARIGRALDVPEAWFFVGAPGGARAGDGGGAPPAAGRRAPAAPGLAEDGAGFAWDGAAPAGTAEGAAAPDHPEVLALVRSYARIRDREVRRRLAQLARALADMGPPPDAPPPAA